jgi:hypothetical protein
VYGTVIARTGWTFEYIDDCGLSRLLGFLMFIGRDGKGSSYGQWTDPTEEVTKEQLKETQAFLPPGALPVGGAIPDKLKEAIRWAEEQKAKHKLN